MEIQDKLPHARVVGNDFLLCYYYYYYYYY